MNPTLRRILILAIGLVLFFGGAFSWLVYKISDGLGSVLDREVPGPLKESRVMIGSEQFSRSVFFTKDSNASTDRMRTKRDIDSMVAKSIYGFSDLKLIDDKLIAAGEFGAYVFDRDGNLERTITFAPVAMKVDLFGIEFNSDQHASDDIQIARLAPNRVGFYSIGSTHGFRVFDENGEALWSMGSETLKIGETFKDEKERSKEIEKGHHVLEGTIGDLDNDGIAEYVVARNSDGVRAYRQNGDEIWFLPDEFPSDKLFVADTDSDGTNELVSLGHNTTIRRGNGKIVREASQTVTANDSFTIGVDRVSGKNVALFCEILQLKFECQDIEGRKIVSGDAPLSEVPTAESTRVDIPGHPELSYLRNSESIYKPKIIIAKLEKDRPPYYVSVGAFIGIPRANLYIWNSYGKLVYHELLPEDAETIALLPTENGPNQVLIGGKNTIWKLASVISERRAG